MAGTSTGYRGYGTVPTVHVFLYGSVTYFSFGRIRIRLFDGQGSLLYHFAGYTGTHPTFCCDEYGTDPTFQFAGSADAYGIVDDKILL